MSHNQGTMCCQHLIITPLEAMPQNNGENSSDHGARVQMSYGNVHDRKSQVGFALLCFALCQFRPLSRPPQPPGNAPNGISDHHFWGRATAFYSSTWHGPRLPISMRHFRVYLSFSLPNICCLTCISGNVSVPQASGVAKSNGENLGEGQPWGHPGPVGPPSERTPAISGLQSPERHASRIAI